MAIKKIGNVFKNETTAKRTLREIKLLLHFDHENVICIRDLMASATDCSDLYVVTHLMDTDLHKVIRSPQPLSDQHVQYFLYQLLRGLTYIHSCNVLHRDLRPPNPPASHPIARIDENTKMPTNGYKKTWKG